jgi:hypothetical protein
MEHNLYLGGSGCRCFQTGRNEHMKSEAKKRLLSAYRERKVVGGVFAIRNTDHGKRLIDSTVDLHGSRNRFDFMKKTGSCYHLKLRGEWSGNPPFVFEVLEELEKGETQTDSEFAEDVKALRELWLEKLRDERFY